MTETVAEAGLRELIERRATDDRQHGSLDAQLDRAAKKRAAQLRKETEAEWRRFHTNMSRLHQKLADEHSEKARRLGA